MPPRALAKAVAISKEQDGGAFAAGRGETVENFVVRLQGLPADRRALELTKLALRFPRPIAR
jgi:hypothetical protein